MQTIEILVASTTIPIQANVEERYQCTISDMTSAFQKVYILHNRVRSDCTFW